MLLINKLNSNLLNSLINIKNWAKYYNIIEYKTFLTNDKIIEFYNNKKIQINDNYKDPIYYNFLGLFFLYESKNTELKKIGLNHFYNF